MKIVTLLSGGLDSTTLLHYMINYYDLAPSDVVALSFHYGQRHSKEVKVAAEIAKDLGIEHHIIALRVVDGDRHVQFTRPLGVLFTGSSLTNDSVPVPDGHYAEESMKQTIVPNRNAIMLSIAYGIAVDRGARFVSFAAHSGDHAIYPDCRPDFVELLNKALKLGNLWATPQVDLIGPFLEKTKSEIAAWAFKLMTPEQIATTWSCYKGGDIHCGTCGTCYERREAFQLAGVTDPTEYLDSTTVFTTPEGA
jgi:7-cyano-7-deazaguanine synthase